LAVSYISAGNVRQEAGEWDAAREMFAKAVELLRPLAKDDPENIDVQANFVLALARAGQHEEAAGKAEVLRSLAPENFRNLYNVACTYSLCAVALRGGKEESAVSPTDRELASSYVKQALDTLQAALAAGFKDFELLRSDPDLAPLRSRAEWPAIAAAGN
jgi:tetratricopeptide (TPR) repeat protein